MEFDSSPSWHCNSKARLVVTFHCHSSLLQHHQDLLLQPSLLHQLRFTNLGFQLQQSPTTITFHRSSILTTYKIFEQFIDIHDGQCLEQAKSFYPHEFLGSLYFYSNLPSVGIECLASELLELLVLNQK
ncbi:uncharacterized protein LOC114288231 [Camellia sinensis]|uniref:uncharacterized protein LOC114288231 n=1 Tax=Camellia sinensis TaxID=4442 RepID=UPI001035EB7F|nr:uncharacterized protein LOC114288231 [Camellia sinensis]XP_028087516.1 uncharacterized protein LOC114288231 [Camellia sinensis]